MKALIVTAHGSRRAESNNEFIQIVEKVKALFDPSEYSVTHAFLEIEPPFLSEQLPLVIAQGYSTIDIFPYSL